MTDKRLLSAVMVLTIVMAGAGAAFYGSIIDGLGAAGSMMTHILDESPSDDDPGYGDAAVVGTWTSGDCTCKLYDNGRFDVSGSGSRGDMQDYNLYTDAPWDQYRNDILSVTAQFVSHIGEQTFTMCANLVSVTIVENLSKSISIGNSAFQSCTSLTSVTIPDSVASIGRSAFFRCTSLASVTIPGSVTSIDYRAFYNCPSLTSIEFPASTWNVTSIGTDAFSLGLSSSPVTCTVYSINNVANTKLDAYRGSYTTFNYEASTEWQSGACTVTLNRSTWAMTVTGNGAMNNYSSPLMSDPLQDPDAQAPWAQYGGQIRSLNIGSGVTTVGTWAFQNCTALTSVSIQNTVTDVGASSFRGCTSLAQIALPSSVTSIGATAFYDCSSLTSMIIPDSVTAIGVGTFRECTSLASVTIGGGVTNIGSDGFRGCRSLTSIEFTSAIWSMTIGSNAFALGTSTRPVTCTVGSPNNVADTKLDAYKNTYTTFNYVSTTVTVTLAAGTGGSVSPSHLIVPRDSPVSASGNVLTVGSSTATATPSLGYAFSQWTGIPQSGTITEDCSITAQFEHATSWTSGACTVTLNMDTYAMAVTGNGQMQDYDDDLSNASQPWTSYMAQIQSLTVGNGVTTIGDCAFIGATSLASVTLPNTLYQIGYGSFRGCTSLTSVTIPGSVQSIEANALRGCTSLTQITVPGSVGAIYNFAFEGCTSLASVTVMGGDGSLTVGDSAFSGCTALASLDLGGRTDVIDNFAFNGCAALTSVSLPAVVERIGESTFAGCTSLTTIYYDGLEWGITSIGSNAFSLGTSGAPVTCTVNSPLNVADGKLDPYKGEYTTFTYASHGWYVITFEADQPGWGTVSTQEYQIRENEQITAEGNAIMHGDTIVARASPSNPTSEYAYAFHAWSIQGSVTVTEDMTVTALFVRAPVVNVTVIQQEYVDLDASPSYTGAEQVTVLPSWLSLDGTHIIGQVPAQNDIGTALIYWAKGSVERQDWTAYYYVFNTVASKEIELSAGATQDIGADGVMAILGHGDLTEAMCDMLAPFRDIVTVVDIRGLTSIRAMPGISNQFTLVLGDTVTNYRDQSDSNHFDAVAIGAGIQTFSVPGFSAFDKDGKQITGRELQGRMLKEERARQYIEVGVISTANHYDNATVYAVKGSTMDNSADDRITFSIQEDAPSLPNYLRTMLQGASASWNVSITTAFKNLQVGQDGVLRGVQADKTGTYTGAQTASMTASEWGQMYSCTIMQSLAFTAYIAEKLEVTS